MDNPAFYETFDWSNLDSKTLRPKIDKILEVIPPDVKTVIDVGCGDGKITNILSLKYEITGVDRSQNALNFVKTKKIRSGSDNIPVQDNSFDLVFSSELLEHLEEDALFNTIKEFKRISKRYILISVPNKENVKKNLIQCQNCHYIFNKSYHLRGFGSSDILNYFKEYKLVDVSESGTLIRHYNTRLSKIKTRITPPDSWILNYVVPKEKRHSFCPKCEQEFSYPYRFNLLAFAIDMLNIIISPKRPYWLMILLQKKD